MKIRHIDFYSGKTVLVTGHTGFKGAWLALWLTKLGARVIGLSLPEKDDSSRASFQPNIAASVALDLCDHAAVIAAVQAHAPQIVFHLAAQSLVRRSVEWPLETFATNIMGTAHVLDAAMRTPAVRAVVNVTSDKCYENQEKSRPFREGDPLGGHDPYSASKACSEIITAAWRESVKGQRSLSVATARAGNVIGGGDNAADRIVPDIVRAIAAKRPVTLRNPSAMRPWQHVLEPLLGYLMLARTLCEDAARGEGAWNFGPDSKQVIEVRELARRLIVRFGAGDIIEAQDREGTHEAQNLFLDSSKAKHGLGWEPTMSLDRAIDLTVDWYKRSAVGENQISLTEEQIAQFEMGLVD